MAKNASILLCAALVSAAGAQAKPKLHVGDPAPPINVAKWVKGQPITQFRKGKVYVVEFWATWCGPCKKSIPHLTELQKKFGSQATVIGVSAFEKHKPNDESYLAKVAAFVKSMGDQMNYTVGADGKTGYMGNTWMNAAAQDQIPTAFIVDGAGKVAWIGDPDGLDDILPQVVSGSFNVSAEVARREKNRETGAARAKLFAPLIAKLKAKDHAGAVAEIEKIVVADPQQRDSLIMTWFEELLYVDEAAALKLAAEMGDGIYKDVPPALNEIAWDLVGEKYPVKNPDVALAVRLAEHAAELTKNEDANILDTLAVSYFKSGRIDDAIGASQKAVTLAEANEDFNKDSLREMKARLDKFSKAKNKG